MIGRASQPLSFLLLIATIYQLGASPCGCWEHCGWRQAALHLTCAWDGCDADHETNAVESAECDHADFPAAMVTPRSGLLSIESVALSAAAPSPLLASAANGPHATRSSRQGIDEFAPPLRAELQVFRL